MKTGSNVRLKAIFYYVRYHANRFQPTVRVALRVVSFLYNLSGSREISGDLGVLVIADHRWVAAQGFPPTCSLPRVRLLRTGCHVGSPSRGAQVGAGISGKPGELCHWTETSVR